MCAGVFPAVGEVAFTCDDVFNAVTIDVCASHGVGLGEGDYFRVFRRVGGHDVVLFEGDFTVLGFYLFIPC